MNKKVKVYRAYVHGGKVEVDWYWSSHPKGHHLTEEDARDAIKPVLPKAKEKFNSIREKLRQMESSLGFELSYTMEGDTHGIHEDHLDIDFSMDGFNFSFPLEY